MLTGQTDSTITFAFRHHNASVANGSFTKTLLKNGVAQAQTITISQVSTVPGGALYTGTFATDSTSGAYWFIDICETADPVAAYVETFYVLPQSFFLA